MSPSAALGEPMFLEADDYRLYRRQVAAAARGAQGKRKTIESAGFQRSH